MKILFVHNKYKNFSGEEAVLEAQIELLRRNNHIVNTYFRHSEELNMMKDGHIRAFLSGIYNPKSVNELNKIIDEFVPDIVHVHNLYPLISPSVLADIKKKGIPIVMTVHNYRLMCPTGLFYSKGHICEKCTSGAMEFNCIINNCENSYGKSVGYAIRNFWARINNSYKKNVDVLLCLTNFQKHKLVENGFKVNNCTVLPNFYGKEGFNSKFATESRKYVAFAGRISPEKGISNLLRAAKELPLIEFRIAGEGEEAFIKKLEIPPNVRMLGMLNPDELSHFYEGARFIVLTSKWYEGFPMVIPEAMAHGLPIIAPKMASFPEIVTENINGLLFKPNDLTSLLTTIKTLWGEKELLEQMSHNNIKKVSTEFDKDNYISRLETIYKSLLN
jgi:glycosyltransferase involved in cell wall biosynthesis